MCQQQKAEKDTEMSVQFEKKAWRTSFKLEIVNNYSLGLNSCKHFLGDYSFKLPHMVVFTKYQFNKHTRLNLNPCPL